MEDIPPSYHSINPSVLDLLPPYLDTASFVSLCLVSKLYYATFIPHLWGSPASHFVPLTGQSANGPSSTDPINIQVTSSHNDMVYVALTRFKRTLRKARLSTRQLCHTLHLPPALSEIYGGPNATWLKEVLDRLPALQSLCVAGLPFFDHHSLVSVDRLRQGSSPSNSETSGVQNYTVKLLLASKEPNVTSTGLSSFLPHLPSLVYLDLSYTTPARDPNVLYSFSALVDLQVLKLRGIGLRDTEAEVLANAIGLKVRLLDVAENQLTDKGLRSLLEACFLLPSAQSQKGNPTRQQQRQTNGPQYSRRLLESWPVGLPPSPDFLSLDTLRTVDLDKDLLKQLTNPLTGRLAFEDIPHGGITHLYISGNTGISVEGLRSLLDLGRLHVLDASDIGSLTALDFFSLQSRRRSNSKTMSVTQDISRSVKQMRSLRHRYKNSQSSVNSFELPPSPEDEDDDSFFEEIKLPGAEKLIPVLIDKASTNLTHLRIEHPLITRTLDLAKENKIRDQKIQGKQELPGTMPLAAELSDKPRNIFEAPGSRHYAAEMPAESDVFEMDATPVMLRAELPGDPIHFAISPPVGEGPESQEEPVKIPIRADGAYAPEPVQNNEETIEDEPEEEVVLNASGSGLRRQKTDSTQSGTSNSSSRPASLPQQSPKIQPKQSISLAASVTTNAAMSNFHRQARIETLMSLRPKRPITHLHPSALPNLRTLILTKVPPEVPESASSVVENLKKFITACAAESQLAALRARTNYSLPPGRARHEAERDHARTLFALRTIVLEMSSDQEISRQRDWKHTRHRLNLSKSSTGDIDSEALWTAAENDFSFFGEEGEEADECGIYDQEPEKYFPTTSFDEKIAISGEEADHPFRNGLRSPRTDYAPSPVYDARSGSPRSSSFGGTLSPVSAITRQGTVFQSPRELPLGRNRRNSGEAQRNSPVLNWDLPERPLSSSAPRSDKTFEMPGTIPARALPQAPTSNPIQPVNQQQQQPEPKLDVVVALAAWRRERKAAYEEEWRKQRRLGKVGAHVPINDVIADVYVEGYWPGEVKVIRNAKSAAKNKGRMARTGNVDVYGNYFEGGYLYP